MIKSRLDNRNSAMDIIRIVAVFSVISVHFLLHNGFYSQIVTGLPMYIMVLMRTLFSVCVPLFIILTGYLMSKKELSKKYYSGISKTLIVFVLVTIACMAYKAIAKGEAFDPKSLLLGTLDFTGANYSWYIEMYIGLFLLIPFINLAYNKLANKKQKQILVFTLIFITIVPSLFNIFNFDSFAWWSDPKISDSFAKLIPSWWSGFYPLAYYFTGCYIREYGIKLRTRSLLILFVLALFLFGSFNFYRSFGAPFKSHSYIYWNGFEPYILSVFLFVLLSRIKTNNFKPTVKLVLWKISDLALGIYLLSYIFDMIVYPILNSKVPVMTNRLPFYFVVVPIVFILSMCASAIVNLLTKFIMFAYKKIKAFIQDKKEKDNSILIRDCLFILLMAGAIIFAFWKCFYGFGGNDEAFYLTIPKRFLMGDAPILDEWHLSQLSGFLLMPFVGLYQLIVGSTEGIILTARFVYVIFHALISIVIYSRFRKYGYIPLFASVLFFIFTPFDIMAMSYNTMGLDFVALTGVIMGTTNYKKKLPLVISGLSFAAAVLCCPYLAIAYIIYALCVGVHKLIKNKETNFILKSELFAGKTFLYFSIGIFILAAIFIIFVLSRVSVDKIFEVLPNLFTDPEHPQQPIISKISSYFKSIYKSADLFGFSIISYLITLIIMMIDKNRRKHRSLYLIATSCITVFSYILFMPNLQTISYNSIMFPMIFVGITSYVLCNNKQKELFASLFILGILYSLSIHFSSNQTFIVIFMATTATNLASFVFLSQLIREMNENPDEIEYPIAIKNCSFALIGLVLAVLSVMEITLKAEHCFWEFYTPDKLTSQISNGPAKGIYTTYNNSDIYEQIYSDIQDYKSKDKDNILFLTPRTWCYLDVDNSFGTFSAWISDDENSNLDRLKTYYQVNPNKVPKYIYVPKDVKWNIGQIFNYASSKGYVMTNGSAGYKLEKIH